MRAFSQLDISNRAIARLPAAAIQSIDEDSLEAQECRRSYPEVVADMLEGPHDWSFANQRVRPALLAMNDRSDTWLYAYALPSNLGNPVRVLPDLTGLGLAIPIPLAGEPYAEVWAGAVRHLEMPYEIEGQALYCNASSATLEYTVNDIAGVPIPQLAIKALTIDLAARICVPVKKDSAREATLIQQAELAWQQAIADDRNRQPECYSEDFIPEAIAARHGATCGWV